jgi:hypothetical protein
VVLDAMRPAERLAFVLHDVFGVLWVPKTRSVSWDLRFSGI